MKGKLFQLGLTCLFLGLFQVALGQDGRVYVSNNPDGPGISIRWAGPEISYQEGISIYRRSGRGNWTLITPPIMPPTSVPTHIELTDNDRGIVEGFLATDHKEFVDGFSGILILMESLKNYRLALALNIAYNDLTAEKGKKYSYKVEAKLKGKTVLLGETEEIKCGDFKALPTPENITVLRKKRFCSIWWDNDEDHYYAYNIYVKGPTDPDFKLHTRELGSGNLSGKKENFLQIRTHKDSLYVLRIQALDYFGGKSEMSEDIRLEIEDLDPPLAPELLVKSDAKTAQITVNWPKSTEADAAGYNIYRKQDGVDTAFVLQNKKLIPLEDTLYVDKVGEPGVYDYQLEVLDEAGNSAKSLPEFAEVQDIIPPPVPDFISIKADTGKFIIRWQPVKAKDLRGYIVMRSVADENNEDNVFMPASEILDTNYFAEPMAANVRAPFVYVVRSVDSLLNKSLNSKAVIGQLPDVTPPVKPFIKEVKEEEGALRIVWMENVEKDLKGYDIYKREEGDTAAFKKLNGLMVPKDIAAYTDKEAERGVAYEYQVIAVDHADLRSPFSNTATGRMENLPLTGEVAISKQKFNVYKQEITLAWSGDKLENEPIVGYAVFRSQDGGKALQRGKVTNNEQFKEKLTQPGTYQYHIRVYGERGNVLHSEPVEIEVSEE